MIQYINRPRGSGKTYEIVNHALKTGATVVVAHEQRKRYVLSLAAEILGKKFSCDIKKHINVVTIQELNEGKLLGVDKKKRRLAIDNLEEFLLFHFYQYEITAASDDFGKRKNFPKAIQDMLKPSYPKIIKYE